jgi:hypothetical protein
MDLHDLSGENGVCGVPVIPGIYTKLYAVCACDIESFPSVGAYDVDSPEDSVTLQGDIVLKPGKKWAVVDIITDTGYIKNILQGSVGSKSFKNDLYFELPGTHPRTLAWHERSKNGCMVFAVEEKIGQHRVIGSVKQPAHYESLEVGNGPEESKSLGLVYDTIGRIAPIYEGSFDLESGEGE